MRRAARPTESRVTLADAVAPFGSVAENAVFARTGVPSSSTQMSNTSY